MASLAAIYWTTIGFTNEFRQDNLIKWHKCNGQADAPSSGLCNFPLSQSTLDETRELCKMIDADENDHDFHQARNLAELRFCAAHQNQAEAFHLTWELKYTHVLDGRLPRASMEGEVWSYHEMVGNVQYRTAMVLEGGIVTLGMERNCIWRHCAEGQMQLWCRGVDVDDQAVWELWWVCGKMMDILQDMMELYEVARGM